MKTKLPFLPFLALVVGFALMPATEAQGAPVEFGFPPGVDWNNATPDQIADAVFNAVKSNPDAAPDIAVAGLESAAQTGRWARTAVQDGKQTTDPDGSSGDPDPGIEDIANVITDAASRANPAMAPQIQSAVSNAVSSLPPAGSPGPAGSGDGGGGGGGAPPVPAPIPGGGGGGGGSGQQPASN